LASGFLKVASKEANEVLKDLTSIGKSAAIDKACSFIEKRTGLPNSICNRAGEVVVDTLIKQVRDKLR